jgi:hypothetical protein
MIDLMRRPMTADIVESLASEASVRPGAFAE